MAKVLLMFSLLLMIRAMGWKRVIHHHKEWEIVDCVSKVGEQLKKRT